MRKETLQEKIERVVAESVDISNYTPQWVEWYEQEKEHLKEYLPGELILRIEHFGSTSVPGMIAKPIVDMVIEISDEKLGKTLIPEVLEPQGYDCFWRPLGNKDEPPYFTWCIKRNEDGDRTHHLHFVKSGFKAEELRFRDILRNSAEIAAEYGRLKQNLSNLYPADRIAYTESKGGFIRDVLNSN